MKLFLNKYLAVACALFLFCAACAQNADPQPVPVGKTVTIDDLTNIEEKVDVLKMQVLNTSDPADADIGRKSAEIKTAATAEVRPLDAETNPEYIAGKLADWDKNLNTLRTHFDQETYFEDILISSSRGRLFYRQPAGLRLEQQDEEGDTVQTLVTDKKTILVLDPKGKEISRGDWKSWVDGQPNKMLFDFGNYTELVKQHTITKVDKQQHSTVIFLEPKKKGKDPYILEVTVGNKDFFPRKIVLSSAEIKTAATLRGAIKNLTLDDALFSLGAEKEKKTK